MPVGQSWKPPSRLERQARIRKILFKVEHKTRDWLEHLFNRSEHELEVQARARRDGAEYERKWIR